MSPPAVLRTHLPYAAGHVASLRQIKPIEQKYVAPTIPATKAKAATAINLTIVSLDV
jgi:hypothetical protein